MSVHTFPVLMFGALFFVVSHCSPSEQKEIQQMKEQIAELTQEVHQLQEQMKAPPPGPPPPPNNSIGGSCTANPGNNANILMSVMFSSPAECQRFKPRLPLRVASVPGDTPVAYPNCTNNGVWCFSAPHSSADVTWTGFTGFNVTLVDVAVYAYNYLIVSFQTAAECDKVATYPCSKKNPNFLYLKGPMGGYTDYTVASSGFPPGLRGMESLTLHVG
eukprot:TRINITY_DN67028_c3_g3_i1.p1 TRINITY_DN67028_c3_g3~~TRINITY_DN67028_c3_g3_i1.p1  ORF type:complete len:232 (+),score=18.55 TRINITY_DN67028_c3_g3_i1:47-697(+)